MPDCRVYWLPIALNDRQGDARDAGDLYPLMATRAKSAKFTPSGLT
jgi:hypothetical protein